jgi:ABC-type transport system involved in cytochrome c biogenesis permease subunit
MLSGVGIICFAASYTVALALEVSRLLFRSGIRGAVMLGFAGAGLVAHTAFLYYRAVSSAGAPLSSQRDWYLVAAWVLVVVYLYLVYYHPRNPFGLFLLPLVLGLIGAGRYFAQAQPFAREPASKAWGVVHAGSIVLASVSVLVGFAAGLMYFVHVRRLKRKLPPGRGLRLPSLEWLQRTNSRAIVVSVLMLGVGVLSGIILVHDRQPTGRLPWYDPVVLGTILMFGWLLMAAVVGKLYRPARAGRKVAYLTVVSFVFLVIALAMGLFFNTQHGGARNQGGGRKAEGGVSMESDLVLPPSAYCLLPTAYRLPPSAYCLLPTAYRLPPTAYRLPPTAYRLPPTAYRLPPTAPGGAA